LIGPTKTTNDCGAFILPSILRGFRYDAIRCIVRCNQTEASSPLHGNAMSFRFELDRLTDYSTADIENEIRRVADLLAVAPLKKREFDNESKVHSSTVIRRFGSWQAGLEAAGRGHLYDGGAVTEKMRTQKGRDLRDEDLLAELRRIAQALGRSDLTIDDINSHSIVGQQPQYRWSGHF
jgi:Homing endonuclease associated repeat